MNTYTVYFCRGDTRTVETDCYSKVLHILYDTYPETQGWDILKVITT